MSATLRRHVAAYSIATMARGSGNATSLLEHGGISGTFTAPWQIETLLDKPADSGFKTVRRWTLIDLSNQGGPFVVIGEGEAVCDPCTLEGLKGRVTLKLTVVGTGVVNQYGELQGAENLGGTWTVVDADGELSGLGGSGTYDGRNPIVFVGSLNLPSE